jgi:hypothetical protein
VPSLDRASWLNDDAELARFLRARLRGKDGPTPLVSRDEDYQDLLEDAFRRVDGELKQRFLAELDEVLAEFWPCGEAGDEDPAVFRRAVNLAPMSSN